MAIPDTRRHRTRMIIFFSDVDKAGIVYTAHFADYTLKGWEDYFRNIGIPWESFVGGPVIRGLPVVRLHILFHSPAYCGDQIEIETRISKITRHRIYFKSTIVNLTTGRALTTANMTVAAFGMDYKSCPIPDFILEAINGKGIYKNGQ